MVVMNCETRGKFADYGISIDSESGRDWRVAIIRGFGSIPACHEFSLVDISVSWQP